MAFKVYEVATIYRFTSNADKVLGDMATRADAAAVSIDRLTVAFGEAEKASVSFAAAISRASKATVDGGRLITNTFNRMGGAADRAGIMVDSAMSDIEIGVTATAARVDAATATMAAGFRRVAASARGAALASNSGGGGHGGMGPLGVVGLASAATLGVGIEQASSTQGALLRLQMQTGRSYADLSNSLLPVARDVSNRTGMSMTDALNVASEVSGVIKDPKELYTSLAGQNGQGGILDLVQVLKMNHVGGANPEENARNVVTLDHILNAYTGSAMANVNDKLYRAVVNSKMDLGKVVTQVGYFGEQYRLASGNRPGAVDDILDLAQLGYWGIGRGKWGSGFGQIIRTIGRPPAHAVPVLEQLGILDANGKFSSTTQNAAGEFTPMSMIYEMRRRVGARADGTFIPGGLGAKLGQNGVYNQLVNAGFPANAARVVAEAISPKTAGFLSRLQASQKAMPDLMTDEAIGMQGLGMATDRLKAAFENFANVLSGPLIKPLTDAINGLSNFFIGAGSFLSGHPTAAKLAAGGAVTLGVAGVASLLGAGVRVGTHIGMIRPHGTIRGIGDLAGGAMRGLGDFGGNVLRGVGAGMGQGFGAAGGAIGGYVDRSLPGLGIVVRNLGRMAGFAGGAVGGLVRGLEFFGKRAVPLVGELLLLTDAVDFLGRHSGDIGTALGKAAYWIASRGAPMLFDALKNMVIETVKKLANINLTDLTNKDNIFNKAFTIGETIGTDAIKSYMAAQDADRHHGLVTRKSATDAQGHPIVIHNLNLPNVTDHATFVKEVVKQASAASPPKKNPQYTGAGTGSQSVLQTGGQKS